MKGTDWPTARVAGNEIPLRTNSALVVVPEEIVTDEPVALSVPLKDACDPVLTLPKFKAAGAKDNCTGVLPLPESAMFSWASEAFERIARFPEIAPETVGVKTTPNVRLCPAAKFAGRGKPLAVNAPFDMPLCEIVTLVVPVLVRVSVKVCEVPGARLPKVRLAGEAVIWPEAETPEPDKAAVLVIVQEAYLHFRAEGSSSSRCVEALTETEALSIPTACGVNVTFRLALCPGESVQGQDSPLMAYPVPFTLMPEILRLLLPVFVILRA